MLCMAHGIDRARMPTARDMSPRRNDTGLGELAGASALVRTHLEQRVAAYLAALGWWPPEDPVSRLHVTWDEVASIAVETVLREVVVLLEVNIGSSTAPPPKDAVAEGQPASSPRAATGTRSSDDHSWLGAEEAAPLLNTTAHTLRRLAREDRCPVIVRRIGGRWWFPRQDIERFLGRHDERSP